MNKRSDYLTGQLTKKNWQQVAKTGKIGKTATYNDNDNKEISGNIYIL